MLRFFVSLFQRRAPQGAALVLALGLLLGGRPARATHIVGGEMDLQYQTGDRYQLTLNLYFDAVNGNAGALDQDLTASIFEAGTGVRMANVLLPLVGNTFVNYTNPACTRPSLSTRRLVYSAPVQLPASQYNAARGYYVAVERCCRNNGISNIVAPGDAAQTFYLEFPAVVRNGQPFRDSTPRIFPPLADYACRGDLFYYDFAGQDPDGDSLAYDLVTPLNGHATPSVPKPATAASAPYVPIVWGPGRSQLNQIPGTPTLGIDARTGRLTVRPTDIGLFVFGVRCQEFRRGEKIGETRRDFQLQVLNCPVNAPPSLAVLPGSTGRTVYRPGRDTLRLVPGGNRCVRLRFTDPDNSSQLSLSLHPVNFAGPLPTFTTATTGTVHGAGLPDTLVATLCFPECLDSRGGVLRLDVVVADNGCSLPKRDTVRIAFTSRPAPNAAPTLSTSAGTALPLRVRPGQTLAFDLLALDPDADPLTLGVTGRGFDAAALGAAVALQPQSGSRLPGRFVWPVDCRALTTPDGQVREFVFTATATTPCGERQLATATVPVVVDYANVAPVLTSTLPPAPTDPAAPPALVRLNLGQTYEATLSGTDADPNELTLSAAGEQFNLSEAGMSFSTTPQPVGQARGTFRWRADCAGLPAGYRPGQELTVTFTLQEATCRPLPQTRTVRFVVNSPDSVAFVPPNIITPNGDQLNDAFTLPTLPADFCDARFAKVQVFNRWGRLVYESPDRSFRWPGEGTGGVYYYLLTFTDGRKYKGWVEVAP